MTETRNPTISGELAEAKIPPTPRLRIKVQLLVGEDIAIGPGKADLLEHIAATGSISAAGRAMGLSYRRAWSMVAMMNQHFAAPLIVTETGGSGGGGARLSADGHRVLAAFRHLERALNKEAADAGADLLKEIDAAMSSDI